LRTPACSIPPAVHAAFAFAALLALFAITSPRADAAPWGAPEEISIPGGSASWSQVGIDAAGDATALWTRSDGLHLIAQAAERPVAGAWSAPVDLSGASGNAESPTVAVDPAGDAVAAWKQRLAGSEAIETAYKPAGGAWGAPEAVEFGSAVVETPAVAIDEAGHAVLVWRQGVGGNHVIFATSRPAGGSWASPLAISSSALDAAAPDVAMSPDGTAVAAWQSSSGATSVVETNTLPLGGSWTGEEAISAPATVTEPPHVVADATGNFSAIWSRSGTGLVAEVAARPAAGGWQAPEQVSTPALEAHAPQLAVDSAGDAVAAWYRFDGSVGSVEGTNRVAGGPWAAPVRLSPIGAEAEAPQVAMSPAGVAQVVWSGWNEATHNYQLRAARLQLNVGWEPSILVSRELDEAYGPHVAIDQSGHAIVVWNGEVSLGAEIMSSYRDEASPLAVTISGSGSGTVSSTPVGINCGGACTAWFPEGNTVALKEVAAAGSKFAGWTGACSGVGACAVQIGESPAAVGAEFAAEPAAEGGGAPETAAAGIEASAKTPTVNPGPATCTVVGAVPSVGTFAPTAKPGRVVAGIRAKVGVEGPSSVRVTGTLVNAAGKSRRIDLGTLSYHGSGERNLRFALPAAARSELPLGVVAWVSLAVSATPDSAQGCATPGVVTQKLKLKIVKVLSAPQSGVS
jgi:Divergent InlB B-repeat domain